MCRIIEDVPFVLSGLKSQIESDVENSIAWVTIVNEEDVVANMWPLSSITLNGETITDFIEDSLISEDAVGEIETSVEYSAPYYGYFYVSDATDVQPHYVLAYNNKLVLNNGGYKSFGMTQEQLLANVGKNKTQLSSSQFVNTLYSNGVAVESVQIPTIPNTVLCDVVNFGNVTRSV